MWVGESVYLLSLHQTEKNSIINKSLFCIVFSSTHSFACFEKYHITMSYKTKPMLLSTSVECHSFLLQGFVLFAIQRFWWFVNSFSTTGAELKAVWRCRSTVQCLELRYWNGWYIVSTDGPFNSPLKGLKANLKNFHSKTKPEKKIYTNYVC